MTTTPSMADALARLWAKFLPEIDRRVTVLQSAAKALAIGALSSGQRAAAHAEAHKLTGSLGTFGLQRGTELARQAEQLFDETTPEAALNAASAALIVCLAELRAIVDSRK
jgi:HPt (histidine-containing phosphotransfer) domain-containing protein